MTAPTCLEAAWNLEDGDELWRRLSALDRNDLKKQFPYRYYPALLNATTLYPGLQTGERELFAAEQTRFAVWSHRSVERLVHDLPSRRPLEPRDAELLTTIANILKPNEAGVIASFRYGNYGALPYLLASQGRCVVIAVKRQALEKIRDLSRHVQISPLVETCASVTLKVHTGTVTYLDVEDPLLASTLIRCIKVFAAIIVLYTDGNVGARGAKGNSGVVDFHNHQIQVKGGVCFIAERTKTSLLSVLMASPFAEHDNHRCEQVEIGSSRELNAALAAVYRTLERVTESPSVAWLSLSAFHKWRVPTPGSDCYPSLQQRSLGLRRDRVVILPTKRGEMWLDAFTYRNHELPRHVSYTIQEMFGVAGHSRTMTAEDNAIPISQRIMEAVEHLARKGLLVATIDEAPSSLTA